MVCWCTSGRVCSPKSNSKIQQSSLLEPTAGKQSASWGGTERLERAGEEEGPITHPTDFLNARFLMKISPFSLIYVFLDKHSSPSGLSNSVQYSDTNFVSSFLPTCMSLTVWTMDFFFFFFCFIPSWSSLFYGSYAPTWKELSIKVHIVISYWTNIKWVIWKSSFFFHFCSNWFSCSSLINQMPFHCLSSHPVLVLAIFFILFLFRDTSYNPWPAVALCPCASVLPQNGLNWKGP